MTAPGPLRQILPLTSARFFAALYVMLYHTVSQAPWWLGSRSLAMRTIGLGYISVSFFFMLSGFILALVYLHEDRPVDKRRFFVARFARIYPLYAVAMLLDLPHFLYVQRHFGHWSPSGIGLTVLATATLIQAWFANLGGLNSPGWSLSAEAFFYLLFPFAAAVLWKMHGKAMWLFATMFYVGGIVLVKVADRIRGPHANPQSYYPVLHLSTFLLGICLARLFVQIGENEVHRAALSRWAPLVLAAGLAAFAAVPIFDLPLSESLLQHGLLAPLFGLIILSLASGNRTIGTVLSVRALVILGEASFALYLIHDPIFAILRREIERHGPAALFGYFVLTTGLSVASLFLLETPARRWILNKEHDRRLAKAA